MSDRVPINIIRSLIVAQREQRRVRSRTGVNLLLRVVGLITMLSLLASFLFVGVTVGTAAAAYSLVTQDLPTPEEVESASVKSFETTKIYDRTGQHLLYEVIDPNAGDRNWVSLDEVPEHLINATVAMEDKNFWANPGFDWYGITRAFINNLQGKPVQGASSITQQVVKRSVFSVEEQAEKSYSRKVIELLVSMELTRLYDKETILEWYLNTIFYGNLAYGIDAAARTYFGKSATDLTLPEVAMLVPIPQSPALNPFDAPEEAKKRQEIVLRRMVEEGYITQAEADAAAVEPLTYAELEERFDIKAPHFSMYVRRKMEEMYGPELVAGGGLRVYTTLDLDLNRQAQCVAQAYLRILNGEDPAAVIPEAVAAGCQAAQHLPDVPASRIGKDHNVHNAAVMVIRPTTGEILAMVGSADYWNDEIDGKFNVAVDGLRQPGSAFKPFTYVTLLSQGYNAAHMFLDVRKAFEQGEGRPPYVPVNYTRTYHGPVSLRDALAQSLNIPAVEAMSLAGVDNVLRTAHRMGINTLDKGLQHYGLSLTLGGGEVHLIDMTYAFSLFATNGVMYGEPVPEEEQRPGFRELNPVAILRVEDRNGNVLYQYDRPQFQRVLDARLAYLITDILSDRRARLPAFGSPNALELSNGRPAAAKTGTTNDFADNWTIGFTPQYVTGVWMGNTDHSQKMKNTPGSRGAAYIWHAVMEYLHQDEPIVPFSRPEGLIEVQVCEKSGKLPHEHCPVTTELMIPGTEPQEKDTLYQVYPVNKETGKLATIYTPPELVEERVYEVYPSEAQDWLNSLPEDQRPPTPPTEYDTIYGPDLASAEVAIISPTAYSYVRGAVPLIGNARGGDFAFYRVVFGAGMNPTEWTQIGPDHHNQVDKNVLEIFDTTGLEDGFYTLQLQVVGHNQNVRQAILQLTVDNTPPDVDLTYPPEGQVYEYGFDEWVNINAEVRDAYAIDRVEFYKNDEEEPFEVKSVAPYNINWTLEGVGEYSFYVKVYDAAGNETKTEPVTVRVKPRTEP
ncbi:MAG: penicillin-binding protein [Anaerolineae bacterium]